ncbi:MAG: coniferyl-alcohol dehydrogenase [Rhodospirillales bacterium]|jgi:NAD(P)-dependent dehydrogenase (short-subunit alcohol dehydrogenase family)|nr:coniferyl-alcohol dehydrogenase [Rhodospirillales bacterium]
MALQGKTIIISGIASGIGQATAALARQAGAYVIGLDKNPATVELDQFIEIDMSDEGAIDAALEQIDEGADRLCNIAGISMAPPQPMVLKVNFLGPRYLATKLAPRLADGASIVNMASVGGSAWRDNLEQVKPCIALTSMSQAEQFCTEYNVERTLSYKLAKECLIVWTMMNARTWLDRGIRINCVSPGPIETPLLHASQAVSGERGKQITGKAPRIGEPLEVASVVLFLLTGASGFINGADIGVDGGLAATFNRERFDF